MRDIKFRAWNGTDKVYYPTSFEFGVNGVNGLPSIAVPLNGGGYFTTAYIMQYTGLKDKNGKEIWEGDIVFDGFVNKAIVWREASWQLQRDYSFTEDGKEHKGTHYSTLWMWTGETNNAIRVIGNIYENPELLEAQKEGM